MQLHSSENLEANDGPAIHPPLLHSPAATPVESHLHAVVLDVLAPLRDRCTLLQVNIQIDVPDDLTVSADSQWISSAIQHLVLNAIEAMPGGGDLVITAVTDQHTTDLEIADSGPGLLVQPLTRVFDEYYTTKQGHRGMGLVNVRRIAHSAGASITVLNCPEGGAAFTLHFPRTQLSQAAA